MNTRREGCPAAFLILIPGEKMLSDNVAKIALIQFCTRFHLYIHVYALLLQQRGLTLLQISTIESVVIATMFLAEVPTGVIADRVGRRWSVTLSVVLLMCGELLFLFSRSYPLYLVVAVFTGTGFAFASGATEALVYDNLPSDNREAAMKQAMGRINSIGQIAFFLSPIIGGLIVADLAPERFTAAIALTVGALVVGVLVSLTLREPASPRKAERPDSLAIFRNGLAELRGSPRLRRIVLLTVFTAPFTGTLVTTLAAPYLTQNAVPPFMIGLALSLGSLLAAFTQRRAYHVEQALGPRRAITLLTLLPSILYLTLALVSGPWPGWLLVTLMYGTNEMRSPLLSAHQNRLINSQNRATVLSLMNMFLSLFIAVMAPAYAALATRSLPLAFLVIGTVILAAGLVLRVDRIVGEMAGIS
jgi:MFS family permease